MGTPYHQLHLHCVWSTAQRLPLITYEVEESLYSAIAWKCASMRCKLLAIGGVEDHVHIAVRLPTTVAVATLMKEVKGASSHLMNHAIQPAVRFDWQDCYGAFTFARRSLDSVMAYVKNQKAHHANRRLIEEFELDQFRT